MKSWRLTKRASEDLRSIGQNTILFWGIDQAEAYLERLYSTFDMIAAFPEAGVRRSDLGPEVRGRPARSHMIFYRIRIGHVEILRVLHGHADAATAFGDS